MRALSMLLFLLLSLLGGVSAQVAPLVTARQQTLALTQQHDRQFPGHRCTSGGQGDWHTEIVVFPTGRADRVYTFSYGVASAYQLAGHRTRLVWCAKAVGAPEGWEPTALARALAFPLRTTAGALPAERGGLDVISSVAGQVLFTRLDGARRRVCQRATPPDETLRTAFRLNARDHCP
ncbi:hypothetical protein [Deinococcus kurensis]|uniref:hypothetical protein n=1 Tax=Deinococcus kurensis TaxID=2662757 RepID=UPI0012D35B75|nr:hypothetical protein [Deinococcus kurensis]